MLFAFQSPFSKGAILADEVGLGKTIEAGLLLVQKWAERKRRLLVVLPADLRKRWSQELEDKFYLPSVILETRSFNEAIRSGNLNPFQQNAVVLCSYQFACSKESCLRQTAWDLVVIDEAHRLRNVYKNSSKIALSIKQALAPFPKVLLTATPLQNSLLELYGLVSIIDDYAFGDLESYRTRFVRLPNEDNFVELKERHRQLRRPLVRGRDLSRGAGGALRPAAQFLEQHVRGRDQQHAALIGPEPRTRVRPKARPSGSSLSRFATSPR